MNIKISPRRIFREVCNLAICITFFSLVFYVFMFMWSIGEILAVPESPWFFQNFGTLTGRLIQLLVADLFLWLAYEIFDCKNY